MSIWYILSSNDYCKQSKKMFPGANRVYDFESKLKISAHVMTKDCDVGDYCNKARKCLTQKLVNSKCNKDYECENNLGCLNFTCIPYLHLKLENMFNMKHSNIFGNSDIAMEGML